MPRCRKYRNLALIAVISAMCLVRTAEAQRFQTQQPGKKSSASIRTSPRPMNGSRVSVEFFTGRPGVGLPAQEWAQAFEQIGRSVRIRSGRADEQPEVRDDSIAGARRVTVIGKLESNGRVVFPDRTFDTNEVIELDAWLKELEEFGVQGNPDGQPLWGLNEQQFGEIYAALSEQVVDDVRDLPLEDAVERLQIAESYPIRWSNDAERILRDDNAPVRTVRQSLAQFSKGTALAIMLSERGLGFHPLRTPNSKIELIIEPIVPSLKLWPIGWDPKLTPKETAPKLFELITVDLESVPLTSVLESIAERAEVPIIIDYDAVQKKAIAMDQVMVSHPSGRAVLNALVQRFVSKARMTSKLRIDELGHPFIWVTVWQPGPPKP